MMYCRSDTRAMLTCMHAPITLRLHDTPLYCYRYPQVDLGAQSAYPHAKLRTNVLECAVPLA